LDGSGLPGPVPSFALLPEATQHSAPDAVNACVDAGQHGPAGLRGISMNILLRTAFQRIEYEFTFLKI
jgi:hypothetical protein